MWSVVALAVVAFASTNLDNLLLAVLVASRPGQSFGSVAAGILLGSAGVVAVGLGAAYAADWVAPAWLGYLGFLPIAFGLRELYRWIETPPDETDVPEPGPALGVASIAGVMLANSADSLAALVPIFAESQSSLLLALGAAVLATSAVGCLVVRTVSSHDRIGPPVRRMASRLVPFVLIAVGIYVLADTGTDTLF